MYIVEYMKRIILYIFLISLSLEAQEYKLVSSVEFEASSFIGIDSYNNFYSIKDRVLQKQGKDETFIFNDFQLGNISSVDIINPLKIVVFYEDTNTVVLLDNKLNEMERIKFNSLPEFLNVETATNAGNSRLWIFNIDTQQLELYNYRENQKTTVSQPFAGKLLSQASDFNYCFVLTENKLRVFNSYGSLIFEKGVYEFEKIIQHNKNIIAVKENGLFLIYDNQLDTFNNSFEPIKLPLSENTIKDLYLTKEFLYIYDGNKLHTFSITQPK